MTVTMPSPASTSGALGSSLIVGAGCLLALVLVWYVHMHPTGGLFPGILRTHDRLSVADGFVGVDLSGGTSWLVGLPTSSQRYSAPARKNHRWAPMSTMPYPQGLFMAANRRVKL